MILWRIALTEHQKHVYEDVVLNDMSLARLLRNWESSRGGT